MKVSNVKLVDFLGGHGRARRKKREDQALDLDFQNPIIHRQIQGEKIYVPLDLERVWNEVN
jgi:hypothetical protein